MYPKGQTRPKGLFWGGSDEAGGSMSLETFTKAMRRASRASRASRSSRASLGSRFSRSSFASPVKRPEGVEAPVAEV